MKQHVEFDIEWPEGETQPMWYVAPRTASCMHTLAFFGCLPDREDCHVVIERPREVCGKRWTWNGVGFETPEPNRSAYNCTLDAGHDGPCMMELGRAE